MTGTIIDRESAHCTEERVVSVITGQTNWMGSLEELLHNDLRPVPPDDALRLRQRFGRKA